MNQEQMKFRELNDLKTHLRELFISSFQMDSGANLNRLSQNFVAGVRAFGALNQNTIDQINVNTRNFLIAFSNSLKPEIVTALVNIHGRQISPIIEQLNEKGIENLIRGDMQGLIKEGIGNTREINEAYIKKRQKLFQREIKDYGTFQSHLREIKADLSGHQRDL